MLKFCLKPTLILVIYSTKVYSILKSESRRKYYWPELARNDRIGGQDERNFCSWRQHRVGTTTIFFFKMEKRKACDLAGKLIEYQTNTTKIPVYICTVLSSFDICTMSSSSVRIIEVIWKAHCKRNRLKVKKKNIYNNFKSYSFKICNLWSLCRKYVHLTFHALASLCNVLARRWFAYFDCHAGIRFYATAVIFVWTSNGKLSWLRFCQTEKL